MPDRPVRDRPIEEATPTGRNATLEVKERAILSLEDGGSALAEKRSDETGTVATSSGILYDDEMPPLDEVFKALGVVSALLERPESTAVAKLIDSDLEPDRPKVQLTRSAVFVAGGIPAAVTVVGICMLIAGTVSEPIVPNAYIALFVVLVGLVLGATAWTALREG
jgi:hypothetical protein